MIYYAGIGNRDTPRNVLDIMEVVAWHLADLNVCLRSGGATGADSAFSQGCQAARGDCEIYLPWNYFNSVSSCFTNPSDEAIILASKFHPKWNKLSHGAKKLHARNCHQILGWDLQTPSNFVLCYTKDGKIAGGTGQALRIALHFNIPIFNMGKYLNEQQLKYHLEKFLELNLKESNNGNTKTNSNQDT